MHAVYAVIVTYHAQAPQLARLVRALAPQVAGGIIVNNGGAVNPPADGCTSSGFSVLELPENLGVACALNHGVAWALTRQARLVITFDQDSEPDTDLVARLTLAWKQLVAQGQPVAAVGPQHVDARTGHRAAFLAPIRGRRLRLLPTAHTSVEVDHLITSGCLFDTEAWQQVGPFLEPLFIDFVDIEWCLRARHRGWRVYGVGGAELRHCLGDSVQSWRGQQIPHHSVQRHYYLLRNGSYLLTLRWLPRAWRVSNAWHLFKVALFFVVHGQARPARVAAMLRGVRDGLRQRLGPIPPR